MPCPYEQDCYDYEYYNCEDECVFLPIFDDACEIIGWKKCCGGCDENSVCYEPFAGFNYYSAADLQKIKTGVRTPCVPLYSVNLLTQASPHEAVQEDAVQEDAVKARALLPAPLRGFLKVQDVSRPTRYDLTGLFLHEQSTTFETSGWTVTITRMPRTSTTSPLQGRGAAQLFPRQLPITGVAVADKVLSAMVILPECDGPHQYWVTVPESAVSPRPPYRFAQLLTSEWSVLFLREPIGGLASRKSGDCGCQGD